MLCSVLTLCGPTGCSLPGSSVHGIFQARILEWWSFPPPRDLPDPGIEFVPPALAGRFFTTSTTWEALSGINYMSKCAERAVQGFLNLWGTEIRLVLTGSFVTYKPHSSSSFVVETPMCERGAFVFCSSPCILEALVPENTFLPLPVYWNMRKLISLM